MQLLKYLLSISLITTSAIAVAVKPTENIPSPTLMPPALNAQVNGELIYNSVNQGPYFDLPVTYNSKVKSWIQFYQTSGRKDFKLWLERSYRFLPKISPILQEKGMPKDLAYLAMIESGFSQHAVSSAEAVGPWQFMKPTASRYGLKIEWWIDERKNMVKSTAAAATYLNDLYRMFNSWYLAAAAYNMGEGRVKHLVNRYHTSNYWILSKKKDFPVETEQYIPKLIATMLIAKAPGLYGFRDVSPQPPEQYDEFMAPGGTDLETLALYLGLDRDAICRINPEVIKGFIPHFLRQHQIRLPKGQLAKARRFFNSRLVMSN